MAASLAAKSLAQKLKDAKEMGFFDNTLFHGTAAKPTTTLKDGNIFDEFQLWEGNDPTRSTVRSPVSKLGVSLAEQPEVAEDFARLASPDGSEGAAILPLKFRSEKTGTIDLDGSESNDEIFATVADAWGQGFEAIRFTNYTTPQGTKGSFVMVKEPEQIRSVFAEFDPKKKDSRKLMAGMLPAGLGAGMFLPTDEAEASAANELPPGFVLDQANANSENSGLPPGFVLDEPGDQTSLPELPSELQLIDDAGMSRQQKRDVERKNREIKRKQIEFFRGKSEEMGVPFARDLKEIGDAPEFNAFSLRSALASLGANFTFDDREMGDILKKQLGAEIVQDAEGNYVAKLPSGDFAINRPGLSGQDIAKGVSTALAFTPSGRATRIITQGLGGAATQGAIEAGQTALGGEVNKTDIAMAGLAPIVMAGTSNIVTGAFKSKSKAVNQYLSDEVEKVSQQNADDLMEMVGDGVSTGKKPSFQINESAKKAEIRQSIKEGTVDAVGWKVNDKGRIVKDQLQRNLVNSGVDEKLIASTNTMSSADKSAGLKMVELAEDYIRGVKGSELRRPQSVIGDSAMKRFFAIKTSQNKASKDIRAAVEKDLKNKPIDLTNEIDIFTDQLESLGVKFDGNRIIFKGSRLGGSNTAPVRNVFEMTKPSYSSAAEVHELKQAISEQISYDNPAGKPIAKKAENALKQLRASINEKLRGMSDDYADANDRFSRAAEVLVPWTKDMGKRFDPTSDRVDNFVGQELRKTITNYAKANDLITRMNDLDVVAKEFGSDFKDDLMTLVVLNRELEKAFGSFASGSLQGNIEAGANLAIERTAGMTAPLVKAGFNKAKDRLVFTKPSEERLKLLADIKSLLSR